MIGFNPIPLIPDYSFMTTGRILPNGISLEIVDGTEYIALGTYDGELFLYLFGEEYPIKQCCSLGGISIVKISYFSFLSKVLIVVITLESRCYFFPLECHDSEWSPLFTQNLVFSPSCCTIFQGTSGTEIVIGTQNGGLGYFSTETVKPNPKNIWKYRNNWNVGVEIASIAMIDQGKLIIGRGDGKAMFYEVGENAEKTGKNNFISEKFAKEGIYIYVSVNSEKNKISVINGYGRLYIFELAGKNKFQEQAGYEVLINKRPIFTGFYTCQGDDGEVAVVGCADGCLCFLSNRFKNFYRHEEQAQGYFFGKLKRDVILILGQSGLLSFYSKIELLSNFIPRFLDVAKEDVDDLRKILKDKDTTDEGLVTTYLYMPLS